MDAVEIAQDDYYRFLEGKRVVIVGPAETMIGSEQGSLIESYDVVVRLNTVIKSMPFEPSLQRDIGERIDVLYLSGVNVFQLVIQSNILPKFMRHRNARLIKREKKRKNIPEHICEICSVSHGAELRYELEATPTTGICAIYDLLLYPIKELYVTGFTFFQGGGHLFRTSKKFHSNTLIKEIGNHRPQRELELFKTLTQLFDADARTNIRLDEPLKELCR